MAGEGGGFEKTAGGLKRARGVQPVSRWHVSRRPRQRFRPSRDFDDVVGSPWSTDRFRRSAADA